MVKQKKSYTFFIAIVIIVILDQLTKYLVKDQIVNINFIQNTGSFFGIMKGSSVFLIWFSLVVIGIFFYFYDKIQKSELIVKLCSGLIVGGAIGNLIDRIRYGSVTDFINLGWWPSFNIADSAICVGVTLLIIYFLFENKFKKKR